MTQTSEDEMRVIPGIEPVTEVTVHTHMVYGAGLPDPLDTLVLLHLLFMVAGGSSPTAAKVLAALRAEGVQAGNGSGLIGRDAVQASFRRLTEAGFLRRVGQSTGAKGRFGAAGYELYRRPAYNPDWMPREPLSADDASASPQVTPQTAVPGTVDPRKGRKRISAGQTVDGNAVHGDTVNGNAGHGRKRISAGQTVDGNAVHGSVSPPHPPEVGTTPPTPPVTTGSSVTADAGTGRGRGNRSATKTNPGDMPEDLRVAVQFLMELPKPFACGLRSARRFAPKLLEVMPLLGYAVPDEVLAYDLTHRPADGLKDPSSAIGARIEDLRPRHVVLRDRQLVVPVAAPQAPCPAHPQLEAAGCPQCAAESAAERQRRELDEQLGIDDASAREQLAALLGSRGKSKSDRSREAAARQAQQAGAESAKRAEYLRALEQQNP